MTDDYGTATVVRLPCGRVAVTDADPVIGIHASVIADPGPGLLPVDESGAIWLAADPAYRYRPVRFAEPTPGQLVVVCERVEHRADVTSFDDLARGVRVYLGPRGERHEESITVEAP